MFYSERKLVRSTILHSTSRSVYRGHLVIDLGLLHTANNIFRVCDTDNVEKIKTSDQIE
jgi:hypothetical protein